MSLSDKGIKSPQMVDRDLGVVRIPAKVTVSGACCSTTDISGVTLAAAGTADSGCCVMTITLSGFEAEADVALDSARDGSFVIKNHGTIAGATIIETSNLVAVSGAISGTAGSRTVAFTFALGVAGAWVAATDSLTDAEVDLVLPIKLKDF
jgi:hypothetical protein